MSEMRDTPAERAEKAATRRRWITLAEAVAVAGVLIAALSLWMSWSDRHADQQAKTEAAAIDAREKARIDISANASHNGQRLALKGDPHDLQDVAIAFPRALGVGTQRPGGDPVIDASWFKKALLAATDGGADTMEGRLPVLITARYLDGDAQRSVTDSYDIVWRTAGGLPGFGRSLRIEGLRLRTRGGTQAAIDAVWAHSKARR